MPKIHKYGESTNDSNYNGNCMHISSSSGKFQCDWFLLERVYVWSPQVLTVFQWHVTLGGHTLSCQATLIWFVTPTFCTAQNVFLINFLKPDLSYHSKLGTQHILMSSFTAGRPRNRGVIGSRDKKFKSSPKCSHCLWHPPASYYTVHGKVVRV